MASIKHFICNTCGVQYAGSQRPPQSCSICTDDRQYVGRNGQQWTTLNHLREKYHNEFHTVRPGITYIRTEPQFAIGQRAHLIETPAGNILWDCISFMDDATVAEVQQRGGLKAIAISHPHFYDTMVEWSQALGDVPIHLHEDNRPWVMRPDDAVQFWPGETLELMDGVTLIRCGGHFPGSTVLHWRDGADGRGILFTGDTIMALPTPDWVSFMYSYPNYIPLAAGAVRQIVAAVQPFQFDVLYGAFGHFVPRDAAAIVQRSADRYIAAITA